MSSNEFVIENDALMSYTGNKEVVVIPDGIKEIENNAFAGKTLKKVTIPNSVRKIHFAAFAGSGLEEIVIPDSVEKIGDSAFYQCKNLKKVIITNGVKVIDMDAFAESGLEEIAIPNSVTVIGYNAFCGCKNLKKVTIPDIINAIPYNAFSKSGLEEIAIPNSVTEIGANAFYCCKSLKKINCSNLENIKIGNRAFSECKLLTDRNGLLVIQNRLFVCNSKDDTIIIPETVTKIEEGVFNDKVVHLEMQIDCPSWDSHLEYVLDEPETELWHDDIDSEIDSDYEFVEEFHESAASLLYESGSSISFKDKEGKKIAYIVLSIDGEIDSIRNGAILSIKSKNGQFDFKSYDDYFNSLEVTKNKINVALARLEYPYKLSPEMTKVYETYIKDNAEKVGEILIDENRLDTLQLIGEKGLFTPDITKKLTEYATNKHNTSIIAWLHDFNN